MILLSPDAVEDVERITSLSRSKQSRRRATRTGGDLDGDRPIAGIPRYGHADGGRRYSPDRGPVWRVWLYRALCRRARRRRYPLHADMARPRGTDLTLRSSPRDGLGHCETACSDRVDGFRSRLRSSSYGGRGRSPTPRATLTQHPTRHLDDSIIAKARAGKAGKDRRHQGSRNNRILAGCAESR